MFGTNRHISLFILGLFLSITVFSQQKQLTYCNPINIDYSYSPILSKTLHGKFRATADPVIVTYKNDYYLFSTNEKGYWWSSDMYNWKFISRTFLKPDHEPKDDDLCAPSVWIQGDTMLVFGSTYGKNFPIWMSTNPKGNDWKEAVSKFEIGGWDPAHFVDDDGRLYMYNGSSNVFPLYGVELNRKTFEPIGERKGLINLNPDRFGWQRFGEHLDNTFLPPFIEGAWMTKYHGKYYFQYGAPATQFSSYADGVAISDHPLGPFKEESLPFSYKPGGFIRGAGHGATYQDLYKNYWHVATVMLSVKNDFERRIGMWPAGFDKDDVLYMDASFGDYPHYLPAGTADHLKSTFTGWMLLNYNKSLTVSSTLGGYNANNAVDEDIKTYWSAASGNKGEWIQSDLGKISTVNAVQINYADQDAAFLGKQTDIYHQYQLFYSVDGKLWKILIDKSNNKTDVPHDYVELQKPIQARYIKLVNVHMPSGKFAISGLRIFGNAGGAKPEDVQDFVVQRTEKDKRSAWIKWKAADNAFAYNIYIGTEPDKLYNSIMVYNANEYWYKGMDNQKPYYFCIESINENGVSQKTPVLKSL